MVQCGKYSRTDCLIKKVKEQKFDEWKQQPPRAITSCSVRHNYLTYYLTYIGLSQVFQLTIHRAKQNNTSMFLHFR
jgi:hypothetical protein